MNKRLAMVLLCVMGQICGCRQATNGRADQARAMEMEIVMLNQSKTRIYARIKGEDLQAGFGALGVGGEGYMGFIPVKLGGAIEVQWQESALTAPTQQTILTTAHYADRQPPVKSLHFTYHGDGKWSLEAYDDVAQSGNLLE